MPNFSKDTLLRVGRLLNSGETSDPPPLRKLANSGAFGRKAIYNWSLPETDPQYRKMPASAKRMVAMLAYFSAAGLLTDKRMEEIISLETTFENETESQALLRRLRRVLGAVRGGKPGAKAKQPEVDRGAEEEEPYHEHEDDLDDEAEPGETEPSAPVAVSGE